jgi:DNA-binding MarR family transcriptional regulator
VVEPQRFLGEEGLPVSAIENAGGNVKGLERWGYVVVAPDPAGSGRRPPRSRHIVRPTQAGHAAQAVWRPLFAEIEGRWQARFGEAEIGRLRAALGTALDYLGLELPEYLPVLAFNLRARVPAVPVAPAPHLVALLSQVLLAFTLECERESRLALAVGANLLRVTNAQGVRVRDLPRLSGVSKEAVRMAAGVLERGGYAIIEPDPTATRGKIVRLTPKGLSAQDAYRRLPGEIERRWQQRFGAETIRDMRESLERLVGEPNRSPLRAGMEPYADGWRASLPRPEVVPHHPMVLHRGGYPDGS